VARVDMLDDDDGRAEAGGYAAKQLTQRNDAAGRCRDGDDVEGR